VIVEWFPLLASLIGFVLLRKSSEAGWLYKIYAQGHSQSWIITLLAWLGVYIPISENEGINVD
jgi:hypothetical protein